MAPSSQRKKLRRLFVTRLRLSTPALDHLLAVFAGPDPVPCAGSPSASEQWTFSLSTHASDGGFGNGDGQCRKLFGEVVRRTGDGCWTSSSEGHQASSFDVSILRTVSGKEAVSIEGPALQLLPRSASSRMAGSRPWTWSKSSSRPSSNVEKSQFKVTSDSTSSSTWGQCPSS